MGRKKVFEKRIEQLKERFKIIETQLADSSIMSDNKKYVEITKEYSMIKEILNLNERLLDIVLQLEDTIGMLKDSSLEDELKEMAELEKDELETRKQKLEKDIKLLLLPKDPNDDKNTIVEIRAGTGGEEAALFAGSLFRIYKRYAEDKKWKIEILDSSDTGLGGYKEIVFRLEGDSVYKRMRYESGTHRVQRVPDTESSGRIHTSAATVAVLPEAEEVDVYIEEKDLKIDVYRSSGPGGQSVNTMDSAVRITHLPSGLVVQCQDGKSQRQNRLQAMNVLRSRLFAIEEEKKQKERSDARKSQVGSGDRSEKIRTYNYPQGRVSEHRINLTLYKLDGILNGEIDEIVDALIEADYEKELSSLA